MSSGTERIYIETTGCTVYVNGERGTTVLLKHGVGGVTEGAFVRLHARPVMLYLEVGERVGDRNQAAEITSVREVGRDEFDRMTGLAEARTSMGWNIEAATVIPIVERILLAAGCGDVSALAVEIDSALWDAGYRRLAL